MADDIERRLEQVRTSTLRQAALVADEMAADLKENLANGSETEPFSGEQVIKGYLMIARLIRRLDDD